MSRKIKKIELLSESRKSLEKGYKSGSTVCYQRRCHIIILKSEGYSSKEIGVILNCNQLSVNNWIIRYEKLGIAGLKTKSGQGCKPKLIKGDLEVVRKAVQEERQRLTQAKLLIEERLDKRFCTKTLTRFLKVMTAVSNE